MTRLSSLWNAGVNLSRGPIARASALSLGIRLTGLALLFAQAVLTARLLGPAGYGTIATVLAIAQVLAMLAVFGLGPMAVREVPSRLAGGELAALARLWRLSLRIVLLLSILFAAVAVLVAIPAFAGQHTAGERLAFGGLLVVPLALVGLLRGWAQGFDRMWNAQLPSEVMRPALMVAAMLVVALGGLAFSPRDYVMLALIGTVLAAAASFAMLWHSNLRKLPKDAEKPAAKATAMASLPFLGLGITVILQGELNTLLLASLAGPEETGLFQPVARVAPLLALPVQAAGMRFAPKIAEFWRKGDIERVRSLTRTFTWTTSLLTALIAIAIAAAGPWIFALFGKEFIASAPLLWVMAAAYVISAAGGPAGVIFAMARRTGTAAMGQIAGLAVNLAIGVLLIPSYGAAGAVMAMLAAFVTWNLLLVALMRRQLGIDPSLFALVSQPRDRPAA
ncbi:oligosaccharide flippase family protein [Qipengyuania sp. 1NDH17]|uniref:Oligosaccharide flippase family protein n=1 Tax=Qipengyuania polymorpha TaxID=2867234 RepID=A0ABS7IZR6_9SPHN|nr:oligosaccharide flippase family protein [Qipengyuania polymorpha]